MIRRLDGDVVVLLALRRVRRGDLALRGTQLCEQGQPMPAGLLRDTLAVLLDLGHVRAAEPDPQTGLAALSLTDTGADCAAGLAARQRAALPVPPPDHDTNSQDPA